jgi:hypothetical protein
VQLPVAWPLPQLPRTPLKLLYRRMTHEGPSTSTGPDQRTQIIKEHEWERKESDALYGSIPISSEQIRDRGLGARTGVRRQLNGSRYVEVQPIGVLACALSLSHGRPRLRGPHGNY